jgi:hypothetical protein
MDGHFEPVEDGLMGRLHAEVARLERAYAFERAARAALVERLAAAQATQHETIVLLGRFLEMREREKAQWEAALVRARDRAAQGTEDDFSDYPILTFDHVERSPLQPRPGVPMLAAASVPSAPSGAGERVPLLERIEPLARLRRTARRQLARLRVGGGSP